jgi:hypothetical protein
MLNKKDVTIAVAPERGRDLNVRNVALRVMSLAGKNSSRFASTNAKRAERMANIDGLQKEFSEKEATLEALTTEINELEAIVANKPAKPAEPIAAPNPETAPELGAPSPEALDPTKHVEFGEAPWLLPKSIIESWPESTYQEALNLTEAQNLSAENLVLRAARTGSLDKWKEAQSNMFAAQGAGGPTPQPEPAIEPQAPAADGKPDLTYRKVDDMFTVFYPETPAGEKAWASIAAHTDGTGKVLHAQVDGTIEQLREAGYTVAPASEPAQGIDDILAELDEPAAPAANKVYTEQESAELEARAAALRPQIEALSDTELAMMAATAPLSIGGFDALVTGKDASGDKRARLIDKIMANHPDDIEASLTRWRENYAPAAPDPEQVKAAREQAIKDALLALGWEDLGYGSIARTIRGGFKGGMVNPEGLRRLFPRFSEPVLQAVLGEDKVLASVMMGDNESPEAIAKKFDDAVTAIDKDAAPDMTKEEKVARANELGAAAFAAGKKRVPAADAAIAPLLGGGTANDVLTAWLAGWDSANLAAPAFDAQEIADQWRIMPDARRIGVLTAAGIPETSIAILKNKPFEDMPRERQSAIAAALLAETPAAPAAPTVPDGVRRAVEGALETLRGIKSGIDDAAALEQKIGGNGRYQADALRNRQADIERAQGTLAEFRQHAPDNGVDAEAFIASLGGEPDLTPSEAAAEWLKPKEPAAPAPAPEPQAPAANPDIDYMQSIIGGSADLADPAIPARLKQIHADNADNADVQALFKEAVKAYSAYAIAKAKAKLA